MKGGTCASAMPGVILLAPWVGFPSARHATATSSQHKHQLHHHCNHQRQPTTARRVVTSPATAIRSHPTGSSVWELRRHERRRVRTFRLRHVEERSGQHGWPADA
eukprot:9478454-Pyramimonas_sp.AAC.1